MRSRILKFEKKLAVRPAAAAAVLGVSWSSYAKYRCEDQPLPRPVQYHMEALELLPENAGRLVVRRRTRG